MPGVASDRFRTLRAAGWRLLTRGWWMACVLGCGPPRSQQAWPARGTWRLHSAAGGDEVIGSLSVAPGGCGGSSRVRVALYGPTWGTEGEVAARAEQDGSGAIWIDFPLMTGLGQADAALRIEGDEVRLPLGARPGEFDVVLTRQAGVPEPAAIAAAQQRTRDALLREERAWEAGDFLLEDPADHDRVVGEVRFRGAAAAPWVAVEDATWLTDGLVQAQRFADGPDILLAFPVEPAFHGEQGLFRVNAPSRQVVVPMGDRPDPNDRRLRLVPGSRTEAQRERAERQASAEADRLERTWIDRMGRKLARAARAPDGTCRQIGALEQTWRLLFLGYDVHIVPEADRCIAEIRPDPPQHRRHFRGRVGPDGVQNRPPRPALPTPAPPGRSGIRQAKR